MVVLASAIFYRMSDLTVITLYLSSVSEHGRREEKTDRAGNHSPLCWPLYIQKTRLGSDDYIKHLD